jgi:hypothetical protein
MSSSRIVTQVRGRLRSKGGKEGRHMSERWERGVRRCVGVKSNWRRNQVRYLSIDEGELE